MRKAFSSLSTFAERLSETSTRSCRKSSRPRKFYSRRDAATEEEESMSPGFPALANRFGVTIEIDIFDPLDAAPHRAGRFFEFFFHSAKERPQKRQREHAPVEPAKRRLHFHFLLT